MPSVADKGRTLRRLVTARYETSVVRRTGVLLALVGPAFVANFLLLYACAGLLSASQFGVFYSANAVGNILFSGSLVLNLSFTRYLAELRAGHGIASTPRGLWRIERGLLGWGALISALLIASGLLVGGWVGVQSPLIVALVVLDAYTGYLGDLGRVLLQATRRTILLGCYTLVWMLLRLLLCLLGVLLFRTVWAAFSGIVASALVMIAGMNVWLLRVLRHSHDAAGGAAGRLPGVASDLPAVLSYALLVAMANLDILLGYLLLPASLFGAYSASAILPKAILAIILPLQQMLFPLLAGGTARAAAIAGLKGAGVVASVAILGVAVTSLARGLLCGAPPGLVFCVPPLMSVMLWSVVPLALIRILLLADFARRRYLRVGWVLPPSLAYAGWATWQHIDAVGFAWGYVACSITGLALLVVTRLLPGRWQPV
jgi:O-antigen/teichoic acid export membrane protein